MWFLNYAPILQSSLAWGGKNISPFCLKFKRRQISEKSQQKPVSSVRNLSDDGGMCWLDNYHYQLKAFIPKLRFNLHHYT